MEETGGPGENHWPVASHWQTLSHNVVSREPRLIWIRTHSLVVIDTDCIVSCKFNYHTILLIRSWYELSSSCKECCILKLQLQLLRVIPRTMNNIDMAPNWTASRITLPALYILSYRRIAHFIRLAQSVDSHFRDGEGTLYPVT
jgi:hypothetical protein